MREPRELHDAFPSEDERANHIVRLLELDRRLQELKSAAAPSSPQLPRSAVGPEISGVPLAPGDSIEGRLRRWANLFADDIDAIHRARNRLVPNTWLSDHDLRAAVWLAERLLASITGGTTAE